MEYAAARREKGGPVHQRHSGSLGGRASPDSPWRTARDARTRMRFPNIAEAKIGVECTQRDDERQRVGAGRGVVRARRGSDRRDDQDGVTRVAPT